MRGEAAGIARLWDAPETLPLIRRCGATFPRRGKALRKEERTIQTYLEQAFGKSDVTSAKMRAVLREWLDSVSQEDREAFCDALYSILSMGGRAKTFEDLRKGGFSGWAALWKEYAGADERKKQILTEIFGRLAIDVKDELMKAAGQSLRSAGHGIRTVGQNLMGRREPDKTQTK